MIAIDTSEARIALGRRRGEEAEVRLDWHAGDLADLAFLRADSVDLVFSAFAVDDRRRLRPRVTGRWSACSSRTHRSCSRSRIPSRCASTTAAVARPYLDPGPVMVERWGEAVTAYPRSLSETFADLSRAGFRVDTLLELATTSANAPVPSTVVWRARKEGA